jgi:hypothetical protein
MTTPQPFETSTTDEEVTLVAPRFDEEETIVARRVVPLGEVGHDLSAAAPAAATARAPQPPPRRRTWPLAGALVLVSALAGGVLGGVGLFLFQNRAAPRAEAPKQTAAPDNAPAVASQPTPTTEVIDEQPVAPSTSQASGPRADNSDAAPAVNPSNAATETRAAPTNAANNADAEQPKASADGGQAGAPKRGKKGAHDEEIERNERRAKRSDADGQLSRAGTDESGAPAARRVDTITIFDRPRRADRQDRTRRSSGADRIRRIFEGQPQ